ncbi:MAG: cytochrome c [Thiohalomonadales bacterium]
MMKMSESMKSKIQQIVYLLAVTVVLIPIAVVAEEPEVEKTKAATTTTKIEGEGKESGKMKLRKGARVYVEYCRICHGDKGDGQTRARGGLRPPPRNFTTVEAALELNEERMLKSVAEGRPGTGMIAHKDRLSKQEIVDVVDFIRSSFMRTPNKNDVLVKNIAGRKIYTKNCSVCHGDSGSTAVWARSGLNPPPRDFTAPESAKVLTRERMIKSVTEGRPGTGMMPFTRKLDEKQIAQVVDYIREVFLGKAKVAGNSFSPDAMKVLPQDSNHARMRQGGGMPAMQRPPMAPKPPAEAKSMPSVSRPSADPHANMPMMAAPTNNPVPYADPHAGGGLPKPMPAAPLPAIVDADMSLPMPGGLIGDTQAGREFFLGNCFTCHGVTGKGNGPRAHFNTPRPRNFTTAEAGRIFNRVRLFDSITNGRVGTVMPSWSKVLTPQQIANVAEFVFQEFISKGGAKGASREGGEGKAKDSANEGEKGSKAAPKKTSEKSADKKKAS